MRIGFLGQGDPWLSIQYK